MNLSEAGRSPDAAELLLADMNAEAIVETARLDMAWLARLSGIVDLLRQAVMGMSALLLAGVLSSFGNSNNGTGVSVSPLVYAAIPLAIVPLVIGGKSQNNVKQAILLYNTGR